MAIGGCQAGDLQGRTGHYVALHGAQLIEERWVVDDPLTLASVVRQMMADQDGDRNDQGQGYDFTI